AARIRRPPADWARGTGGSARRSLTSRGQIFENERVRGPLASDRRVAPVPRVHDRVVSERKQHLGDGTQQRFVVAARQVGPPDRSRKQRVSDEEILPRGSLPSN